MDASRLHPFLVHFPIALFATAFVLDVVLFVRVRSAWLDRSVVLLYAASAVSGVLAAVSGKLSGDAVMALVTEDVRALVEAHGDWAFGAAVAMFATAVVRFEAFHRDRDGAPRIHRFRGIALAVAFVALFILWQTADRGGELVYRHGVGVSVDAVR